MMIEQSTLERIRTRPRFRLFADVTPEDYTTIVKRLLHENREEFTGNANTEMASISVKSEDFSYWKPTLSLRAEREDGKTVIRGIFGPTSAVWTFFMFLYFLLGILWMVFITLWFVGKQIKSNDFGWALPVSFVVLALTLGVYLAAQYGQKKAKPEMERLRQFALRSVENLNG